MKKTIALLLVLVMAVAMLAACGKKEDNKVTTQATTEAITTEATTEAAETTGAEEDTTGENLDETLPPVVADTETMKVLVDIWNQMGENQFPIAGGHMSTGIMGNPGNYDVTYAEDMQYNLLVPADQTANIAEAASMIHMMNANSFTCGAFLLNEGVEAKAFADAMEAAIQGNQWMCGFPERLIITQVGDVVVVAFGVGDLMTPYAESLSAVYADSTAIYDEEILG